MDKHKKQEKKFFRTPVKGERIEYECGCVYEITNVRGHRFEVFNDVFCVDHDPTLTEYAREHNDEIANAED